MKLTSKDLHKLGLVDTIIPEPLGGAHRSIHDTIYNVEKYLVKTLRDLKRMKNDNLIAARYDKLRSFGTPASEPRRRKTRAGQEKIKEALQTLPSKRKKIPAKV